MPTTQGRLSYFQKMQTSRVKQLSEQAEIWNNRSKNAAIRKEFLQKQKTRNYQTEYDRIRAHLDNSATPYTTPGGLHSRVAKLKELGAKAVSGIQ